MIKNTMLAKHFIKEYHQKYAAIYGD